MLYASQALAASNALCVTHAARGFVRGSHEDVTREGGAAAWLGGLQGGRVAGLVCFDEMQARLARIIWLDVLFCYAAGCRD